MVLLVGLDGNYRTGKVVLLCHTITNDNSLAEVIGHFLEGYRQRLSVPTDFLGIIPNEGDAKDGTALYTGKHEITIIVYHCTISGALNYYGRTGKRLTVGVNNGTLTRTVLLCNCIGFDRCSFCHCKACGEAHQKQHQTD